MVHKPVLLKEIVELLDPKPGEKFVDATINGGGHAQAILEKIGPKGIVLGIDWDCELIEKAKKDNNLKLVCDNYANIKRVIAKHNLGPIAGVLADLGFSSYHIEEAGRGFSFLKDEPLDMRYSPNSGNATASDVVNKWPEKEIENIIRTYGEERFSRSIAKGIVMARASRRISTTGELARIIEKNVPARFRHMRLHPATRTFQALRIAVNQELDNLKNFIPDAIGILSREGKIAIISFHSLEDRIVKNILKEYQRKGEIEIITKKPITALPEEIKDNPRARSAKLRVAKKI